MKLPTTLRRCSALAAVLVLSVSLAACGGDDEGGDDTTSRASSEPTAEPTEVASAGDQTFGEGCAQIPTDGKGSFDGMVQDPVATAASNNPLLSTLVTAVGEADLGGTLDSAPALTVFAPANPAFEAIPPKDLDAVLADKATLSSILTYHVVEGQLDPMTVVGEQATLQGGTVVVEGDESGMTVNGATVLCGNIPTANATVYVIDQVMMPPA